MRRAISLIVIAFLLFPTTAFAAITRDTFGSAGSESSVSSKTFTLVTAGCADAVIVIHGYVTTNTLTATVNGSAATEREFQAGPVGAANNNIYSWTFVATTTGNQVVKVSNSGTSAMDGYAEAFCGADTTAVIDGTNSNSATSGTSITTSITTTVDGAWISGICRMPSANDLTANNSAVLLQAFYTATAFFDTNAAISPAGATTVGCTSDVSTPSLIVAVAIPPAAEGGGAADIILGLVRAFWIF